MKATRRFLPSAISPLSERGAVGEQLALDDLLPGLDERLLVDQRALVGAHELLQLVLVTPTVLGVDDDPGRVDEVDRAGVAGQQHVARVQRRAALHAGARPAGRRSSAAARPGAACSSPSGRGWRRRARGTGSSPSRRTRSAPARRRSGRPRSARRRRTGRPGVRQRMQSPSSLPVLVDRLVGLRDQALLLLGRVDADDLFGEHAVLDDPVGRRDEAVLGDLGVSSTASRSGRCSGPPASRSGTSGRSGSGGRRAPRSARAHA